MSRQTLAMTDALHEYVLSVSLREADALRRLRDETAAMPHANMQLAPEQGQFLALLVRLIGARRTLEVGVFTGYSSTAIALALPPDGRVIACDVSEEYTAVARRYWAEAGVADKIDLRIGPALGTLDALLAAGEADAFDFAFIDADKPNYPHYYERALRLVRPGGLIALDNTLQNGRVADPNAMGESVRIIRALNTHLHGDARVDVSLVPIGDGLTLARKQ